jgi:hypothetical protein
MQTCTLCLQDVLISSECDRSCWLLDSYPGFEFFWLTIMVDPNKKMHASDEVFYELLQENEKLALTSPTSGSRSVGIVRLRTKSHGV